MPIASVRRFFAWLFLCFSTALLVACGGGAGSGSAQNTTSDSLTFTMTLADGTVNNKVPLGSTANLDFVLKDSVGSPIKDAAIRITVDSTISKPIPDSGATLTDASGKARLSLQGIKQGVDVLGIEASINNGARKVTGTLSYEITAAAGSGSPTVTLRLTDSSGTTLQNNTMQQGALVNAIATVLDPQGKPLGSQVVLTFNAGATLIEFVPSSGTELTNAQTGIATIGIKASGAAGADVLTVSASVTYQGKQYDIASSIPYKVAAGTPTAAPVMSVFFSDKNGNALVSGNTILAGLDGYLTASIKNELGQPIANQVVTFTSSSDIASLLPDSGTALTDISGKATIGVLASSKLGAASIAVAASVPNSSGTLKDLTGSANYQVVANGSSVLPPNLILTVTDASGVEDSTLSAGDTLTLTAKLLDNGVGVPGQSIRFSLDTGSSVTALLSASRVNTGSNGPTLGQASVQLTGLPVANTSANKLVATISTIYKGKPYTESADILQLAPVPAVQSIAAAYSATGLPLSYKGSTTLTIHIVDLSQASSPPYTLPLTLKLTSGCQAKGLAAFDDAEPFVNGQGIATVTYSDLGCGKDDVITATPSASNGVAKTTTIQLSQPPATGASVPASVQFVDANPTNLQIQGTGGGETSLVRFKVVDASGLPIAGLTLNFSLQDQNAKIATLKTVSAVTDGQGIAGASVLAGLVGGPVAVVATLNSDNTLWAQSGQLLVSTRIPHQNGFSLSAATLNPEFHDFDGETDTLTVHASDRYGNPVPDGFVVSFKTEGGIGIIQDTNNSAAPVGSCFIKDSTCSVRIKSAGNRSVLEQIGGNLNGRMSIIAFARGEDSFVDVDGNGVYSSGDPYAPTVALGANTFAPAGSYHYGEPFVDNNENGNQEGGEEFVDFDGNGSYSNGLESGIYKYHGLGCTRGDQCSSVSTRYVYDNLVLVWSGSTATFNVSANGSTVSNGSSVILPAPTLSGSTCLAGAAQSFNLQVTDSNGQALPAGTTVAITLDNGTVDSTGFTIPNTSSIAGGAPTVGFGVVGAITTVTDATGAVTGCQTTPGRLLITTTTPKSVVTNWRIFVQ